MVLRLPYSTVSKVPETTCEPHVIDTTAGLYNVRATHQYACVGMQTSTQTEVHQP
jgi:hypothetical protein